MKKPVLIIFTGGTIGSVVSGGVIATAAQSSLIASFREKYPLYDIAFEEAHILNTLSENMTFSGWLCVLEYISKIDASKYSGIAVAHGTDTLDTFACFLSLALAGLKLPLVVVSSNYILSDPRANGTENLCAGLDFMLTSELSGVYAAWCSGGEQKIFHGSRMMRCSPLTNDFPGKALGSIRNGSFHPEDTELLGRIKSEKHTSLSEKILENSAAFLASRVLYIYPHVGMDYRAFDISRAGAVILETYHSGSGCTAGTDGENSLEFIVKCKNSGISVFMPLHGEKTRYLYGTTADMIASGACPVWNILPEALYAKVLIGLAVCRPGELEKFVTETDVAFETL